MRCPPVNRRYPRRVGARGAFPGVVVGALLVWVSPAAAQSGEGAFELEADSIRYDRNAGLSLYRGGVVISRGGMRLTGDEVEVLSRDGEFLRIVARATPSTFRNRSADGRIEAEADTIEYHVKRRVIVFSGGARIDDGERVLRGERIVYDLEKKIVDATKSKGRVRLTIQP